MLGSWHAIDGSGEIGWRQDAFEAMHLPPPIFCKLDAPQSYGFKQSVQFAKLARHRALLSRIGPIPALATFAHRPAAVGLRHALCMDRCRSQLKSRRQHNQQPTSSICVDYKCRAAPDAPPNVSATSHAVRLSVALWRSAMCAI